MRIGVIGGGHGCYAAAADLVEKGHRVRLWRRDGAAFDRLRQAGALTVTDYRGTRRIPLGDGPGQLELASDRAAGTQPDRSASGQGRTAADQGKDDHGRGGTDRAEPERRVALIRRSRRASPPGP